MKKVFRVSALAAVVMLAAGCNNNASAPTPEMKLDNDEQKAAYALGASVGSFASQTLKQQDELGIKLDRELVKRGFIDALDEQVKLTDEELGSILRSHEERLNTLFREKTEAKMAETRKSGEDFLTENAKKDGIKVTESGLQYEVVKEGQGAKPTAADTVTVHYTGKLVDGTVFDSSKDRGQPATFPLANVIKGWTEGVALMSEGAEYRLYVPADLAYGNQDIGTIPAGSVLIFDVELLSIEKKEEPKAEEEKK